ncbi:Uma2 family endonuclease [Actinoplanes couchii]|uniref:Restriction endonuclease domain-containing protein n=1 Tax=Actinoplanes couchii TaxID=403638 RepID=A0ABQ3X5C9_9ACTN|nr:Uma2 family endonuclease [Actinoplanes couchii]MDR6325572.1 hypothetical protein [Actinoplanes couchii]GID53727.1 hypothetical protein Aco03nite_021310 [Actinoplanes couchii]
MTFVLPAQGRWTVDDMAILPAGFRYELTDGTVELRDRAPLASLAGVAVMGALKVDCPPALRVVPRAPLLPAPPTVTVLGEAGPVLVADVAQPEWTFIDLHTRIRLLAALGVPRYWVVEPMGWHELALTVFGTPDEEGYVLEASARGVFTTDVPYPVTLDLPAMATRWPAVREFDRWS